MSEQREAIISLLDPIVGPAYASNAPEAADTVIQYLWQRADDPEVLGAITTFCWPDRDIEWWSTLNDIDKAGYNSSTRTEVAAVLTALLGPRPSGEEAADE